MIMRRWLLTVLALMSASHAAAGPLLGVHRVALLAKAPRKIEKTEAAKSQKPAAPLPDSTSGYSYFDLVGNPAVASQAAYPAGPQRKPWLPARPKIAPAPIRLPAPPPLRPARP